MSILKEFPAYAGMKTSDSGGRTVIDKFFGTNRRGNVDPVWDSGTAYSAGQYVWFPDKDGDIYRALEATSAGESPDTHSAKWDNVNAEWGGNDRPEKHQTLNGKYQACVEKGATNAFRDSDTATDPGQGTRTNITFAPNDWGIKYGTHDLNGKVVFGDNSLDRAYYNSSELEAETIYTASFLIKPDDGNEPTFGSSGSDIAVFLFSASASGITYQVSEFATGIWLVRATGTTGTSSLSVNGLQKNTTRNAIGFEATAIQIEQGSYPTLYIPTTGSAVTRPEPAPVIENALPETGTVGLVTDFVMTDEDTTTDFFENTASTGDGRFLLNIISDTKIFQCRTGGEIFNLTAPWVGDINTRTKIAFGLTYNESDATMYFLNDGNIYSETTSDVTPPSPTSVRLGGRNNPPLRIHSKRFEKPWYTDNIVRVNATDDEIKQFFENLTTGTSMATKKEDMTIV